MRRCSLLFLFGLLAFAARVASGPNDLLYLPENLKPNVAFWELIYQKYPSDRGLIHDADTLRVIYDTLVIGGLEGRSRVKAYGNRIKATSALLKSMAETERTFWTPEMRALEAKWGRELTPAELSCASGRVRFQLGQRDRFIMGLKRSGRYIAHIKEVFKEFGLPEELAYLPHVESSFNYKAYSKVGAAGIWQFMRGTARVYLKVGYVVDERLDPIKATVAAAKLLSSNYRKLKSWPLAVTAYNHGARSMETAVSIHGTTDIGVIVEKYECRSFQFASKNFYACFLAAYKTATHAQELFGDIAIEPPFAYAEVALHKSYRPSYLAKAFGVSVPTLQEYNLDVRPPVFKNNQYLPKDMTLKLPLQYASAKPDSVLGLIPEQVALPEPPKTGYHKVRKGETLARVAKKYRVDLGELASLNNLAPNERLSHGQMLALPGGGAAAEEAKAKEEVAIALRDEKAESLVVAPAPAPVKRAKPEAVKVPKADTAAVKMVVVDTVPVVPRYLLASAFPVRKDTSDTRDSLRRTWDYFYPAMLSLALVVPKKCEICEFNADFYALDFVKQDARRVTLKVQIDETVGHYAEWSGVPSDKIKAINRLSSNLYLGKEIVIPISGDTASDFMNKRIEYHMSIEEDFFSNYTVVGMDTASLGGGKNIWTICQDNDIPLWLILKVNPSLADLRALRPQQILVPQVEEKK